MLLKKSYPRLGRRPLELCELLLLVCDAPLQHIAFQSISGLLNMEAERAMLALKVGKHFLEEVSHTWLMVRTRHDSQARDVLAPSCHAFQSVTAQDRLVDRRHRWQPWLKKQCTWYTKAC